MLQTNSIQIITEQIRSQAQSYKSILNICALRGLASYKHVSTGELQHLPGLHGYVLCLL